MNQLLQKIFFFFFTFFSLQVVAQKTGRDFKLIDSTVRKLGALNKMNMGSISNLLTKNLPDKTDKARAIFTWIAENISYDLKASKNGGADNNNSDFILINRKATGVGYANLFQDMCSSAGIRCLTADGFVKFSTEEIDNSKTEINHRWAIVQLGQSPEAWYYVDVAMGSGYPDADYKNFIKEYNANYFFADLSIFNWQHYPDNTTWKLGPAQKNKNDFFELPVIKSQAYELGLKSFFPNKGKVSVKVEKPLLFSYNISSKASIDKVAIIFGEGKRKKTVDIPFKFSNGKLTFGYTFKEEDNIPVMVVVNGKELAEYLVDIE